MLREFRRLSTVGVDVRVRTVCYLLDGSKLVEDHCGDVVETLGGSTSTDDVGSAGLHKFVVRSRRLKSSTLKFFQSKVAGEL